MLFIPQVDCVPVWNETIISLSCRVLRTCGVSACRPLGSLRLLHCVITNTSSWARALPAATDPSDEIFQWQVLTQGCVSKGCSLGPHYFNFGAAAKSTLNSQLWCTLNLVGAQNGNLQKKKQKNKHTAARTEAPRINWEKNWLDVLDIDFYCSFIYNLLL